MNDGPLTPIGGMMVVVKGNGAGNGEEPPSMASVSAELLDDNLAAFLLAAGVDVAGLITLLDEYLDFSSPTPGPSPVGRGAGELDPMEILQAWYRRDGIEEFLNRLRHDRRTAGKAANAAAVRESPKALGEGKDNESGTGGSEA